MYHAASDPPTFGDIFDGDWFHSAYLRRDAVGLQPEPLRRDDRGSWFETAPSPGRDTLLAHGRRVRAILLNAPSEIDAVLTHRGGTRLLMAGVGEWSPAASAVLGEGVIPDFRRHLLPPADGFEGGVVQFSSLFLVVEDCVRDAQRLTSLNTGAQVNLEVAWEAYAARRGPKAVASHTRKLAAMLTAPGDEVIARDVMADAGLESSSATAARLAINEALELAWKIEGSQLCDVADTADLLLAGRYSGDELRRETEARRTQLRDGFVGLRAAVDSAISALGGDGPSARTEGAGA